MVPMGLTCIASNSLWSWKYGLIPGSCTCVKLLNVDVSEKKYNASAHPAFVWPLITVYNHSAMMEYIHTVLCTSARTILDSALLDKAHSTEATEQMSCNFTPGERGQIHVAGVNKGIRIRLRRKDIIYLM